MDAVEVPVVEAQTEQYIMLRNALLEMRDDSSAVMSLLSFQPDNGAWWMSVANQELRAILIEARLDDADRLGTLISTVLAIQEDGADDELAENQIHREAMRWLVEGIGAILEREPELGIQQLENLTGAVYSQESLQWVAWFWISKAAADTGNLSRAAEAAGEALTMSDKLDDQARSISLRCLGELGLLTGDLPQARDYLDQAGELFIRLGDDLGVATTQLARARVEDAAGRTHEAMDAALRAREAAPDWDEPVLFLARQALITGNPGRAAAVLYPFLQLDTPPAEVRREMALVELLQRGEVTADVIARFCRLRELPPSEEAVAKLKEMVQQAPDFVQLREHYAWQLLKLGRDEEAAEHFDNLASRSLDAEIHSSVLLGLGCLANRRNRHLQTGARLHEAAQAGARAPGDEASAELAGFDSETPEVSGLEGFGVESAETRQSRATSTELPAVALPRPDDEGDVDPAALAAALSQSTVQQASGEQEAMRVVQLEASPPTPEASVDFTVWAEPDEEPDVTPAQIDGASTMRLSGDVLDSLMGASTKTPSPGRAIPRTDSGAIRFDVGDPMPALRADDGPRTARSRGGGGAAKAAFTGDLQLLAVPDLLEFLKSSRRTGTLVVTSESGIGAVNLKGGNITGAASPGSTNLGELLKRDGLVDEDQLATLSDGDGGKEQLLGSMLVSKGLVEPAQIRSALTKQVQSAIIEMLHWTAGRFAFEPEAANESSDAIEIVLDTQGVLLDALREFDELNR